MFVCLAVGRPAICVAGQIRHDSAGVEFSPAGLGDHVADIAGRDALDVGHPTGRGGPHRLFGRRQLEVITLGLSRP